MTGLQIKIARLKRGMRQLKLSRVTKISPTRLSKIENGWEQPRNNELKAIRRALNLGDRHRDEPPRGAALLGRNGGRR